MCMFTCARGARFLTGRGASHARQVADVLRAYTECQVARGLSVRPRVGHALLLEHAHPMHVHACASSHVYGMCALHVYTGECFTG